MRQACERLKQESIPQTEMIQLVVVVSLEPSSILLFPDGLFQAGQSISDALPPPWDWTPQTPANTKILSF